MWWCAATVDDRSGGWKMIYESWPAVTGFGGAKSRSDVMGDRPRVPPSHTRHLTAKRPHGQIVRAGGFGSVDSCWRSMSSVSTPRSAALSIDWMRDEDHNSP